MYPRVKKVKAENNHHLLLLFDNNEYRIADFAQIHFIWIVNLLKI